MTPAAPKPFTSPTLDFGGMRYMPLHIDRLKKSKTWRRCRRRPELAFYLMNMWLYAYRSTPVGSIENDEDALIEAAGCELEQWPMLEKELMLGWVLCSDGRYYHPALSQIAFEAWESRAARTTKARRALAEKRAAQHTDSHGNRSVTNTVTDPVTIGSQTSKEGRKEGIKEVPPPKQHVAHAPPKSNGHDLVTASTEAWAQLAHAIDAGTAPEAWADPRTGPAVDAVGGFDLLTTKTAAALKDLRREFVVAFARAPAHA